MGPGIIALSDIGASWWTPQVSCHPALLPAFLSHTQCHLTKKITKRAKMRVRVLAVRHIKMQMFSTV